MLLYVLLMVYVLICAPIRKRRYYIARRTISGDAAYLFMTFGVLGLVMMLRAPEVGSDTSTYYRMYERIAEASTYWNAITVSTINAPMYVLYAYVLGKIFGSGQMITCMNSAIIAIGMAVFIKKNSKNVMWSTFFFIALTLYFESMNGSRQCMAMVLAVNAFSSLVDDFRSKRGWVLMALSVGIHSTALCFAVAIASVPIAKTIQSKGKLLIWISVICMVGCMLIFPLSYAFSSFFPQYAMYLNGDNPASFLASDGGGRIVIVYLMLAVFVFFGYRVCGKNQYLKNDSLYMMLPSTVICVIIGIIFSKNILMNRLLWYYLAFFIVFIPNTCERYRGNNKRLLYSVAAVFLGAYMLIHLLEDKSAIIPYEMFFMS